MPLFSLRPTQMFPKKGRIRIGVDFDSTIAKIDLPWLDRLNAARGTMYRPEDWSDWDLSFLQPDDRRLFFDLLTPDLYDIVIPYPGAPETIRELAAIPDVEMVCVTSNPEKDADGFLRAKRRWLQKHIPELSDKIISAKTKTNLGLDILIDDAPHHHEESNCVCVLVRRPWNRRVVCPNQFTDWIDANRLLTLLINKIRAEKLKPTIAF
jgi:5'(3')-deoxyribonucleotidase